MGFITPAGLRQLDSYKYVSTGYGPADDFLNRVLWQHIVDVLPMTMAPNLVTLVGLIVLFASFLLAVFFSPNLSEPMPSWVIATVASAQFFYQTMDAIDGKQARRTKSSSPLGQLFDHGCDSLSSFLLILPLAAALRLGYSSFTILLLLMIQGPFFLAQWEEHHTRQFRTYVGFGLGITEGQLVAMGAEIATAVFGGDMWLLPVEKVFPGFLHPVLGFFKVLTVNETLVFGLCCTNSYVIWSNLACVWRKLPAWRDRASAFAELLPLVAHIVLGMLWRYTTSFSDHPWICLSTLGAVFSHLTTQMIICGVTHMRYSLRQYMLIPLALIVLNSYLPTLFPNDFARPPLNETNLVYGYFVLVVLAMWRFLTSVIDQITRYLGIYCLSLEKRPEGPDKTLADEHAKET